MTPDEFKAWRDQAGWSQAVAAIQLGLSKATIENYERGTRREDGRPVEIPRHIELACKALVGSLSPGKAKLRTELENLPRVTRTWLDRYLEKREWKKELVIEVNFDTDPNAYEDAKHLDDILKLIEEGGATMVFHRARVVPVGTR